MIRIGSPLLNTSSTLLKICAVARIIRGIGATIDRYPRSVLF